MSKEYKFNKIKTMGIFGNSPTKDFKNKMVDVFNLIANFSYGDLPMSMTSTVKPTIENNYRQLKSLYNRFSNPFEEYFNSYTTFTSTFGDKISVAEGMYSIYLAKELAFQRQKISTGVYQQIVFEAKTLCSSYAGRQQIISAINNS
jgi:hypothetical protein